MRHTIAPILLLLAIGLLSGCGQPTNPPRAGGPPTVLTQRESDERHAANSLSAAKDFHGEGQQEHAIRTLKELLEKFPDSDAAEEAAQLLAELDTPADDRPDEAETRD